MMRFERWQDLAKSGDLTQLLARWRCGIVASVLVGSRVVGSSVVGGSVDLLGCAGGGTGTGASTPNGGDAALQPGGAAGAAGDSAGSAEGGLSRVHWVGRVDQRQPEAAFAWSGSGAVVAFEGTQAKVTLQDSSNQFTVMLDGQSQPVLVARSGTETYTLAEGLPPGRHVLELYRRTEASFGPSRIVDFDFGPGSLRFPTPAPSRRIELIGDSISAAYGNLGTSPTCRFSADTEDHYQSYGAIGARTLGAELSTVAWSGKGIIYNYDTDTVDPLPALYDRTLPADAASAWDYSNWAADAVVINLGTNDFSTDGDPSPELFVSEYKKLLERVRAHYPEAFILCTVGPLLSGADLAAARSGITAAISQFSENAGNGANIAAWEMNIPNTNPGCDYHPSLAVHAAMAEGLVAELVRGRPDWAASP
jgi:lysophospholipase L1-like esterase